jgi:hypothetical protein
MIALLKVTIMGNVVQYCEVVVVLLQITNKLIQAITLSTLTRVCALGAAHTISINGFCSTEIIARADLN